MWNLVVPANHFVQGPEFEDVQNWGEYLCLHNLGIVFDFHDRWQDIVAIHIVEHFAAVQDLSSLLLNFFQTITVHLDALLGVKRSQQGIVIEWVTHALLKGWIGLDHASNEIVIDILVNKQSSQRRAPLSTRAHRSKDRTLEGKLQITVRHDNCRIVTSKLEDRFTEPSVDLG